MIFEIVGGIGRTATDIVKAKFPKEFYQEEYRIIIFELIEMVGDELAKKNHDIFFRPWLDQLVDIKDLNYGSFEREYVGVFYTKEE